MQHRIWLLIGRDDPLYRLLEEVESEMKKHIGKSTLQDDWMIRRYPDQFNIYPMVEDHETQ